MTFGRPFRDDQTSAPSGGIEPPYPNIGPGKHGQRSSGRLLKSLRITSRGPGTSPIAINAPLCGASGSTTSTCPTAANFRRAATALNALSSGTDRTTAYVPAGSPPGLDSPAAWTKFADWIPRDKSARTTT